MKNIIKFLIMTLIFVLFIVGCVELPNTVGNRKICDERNHCEYSGYHYNR
ncbi:hypothetical protein HMPREF9108_01895 [Leptotrichia sp. oral taxon 225 str. F0581]|nr:hypothetical protein HMPREF9108_01895 [Leptotrichia sp. oral taxon 225 str. F0581]